MVGLVQSMVGQGPWPVTSWLKSVTDFMLMAYQTPFKENSFIFLPHINHGFPYEAALCVVHVELLVLLNLINI